MGVLYSDAYVLLGGRQRSKEFRLPDTNLLKNTHGLLSISHCRLLSSNGLHKRQMPARVTDMYPVFTSRDLPAFGVYIPVRKRFAVQ